MESFEDHGLPLVQLKEQRRELIVALIGRLAPISNIEIAQIASLQQTIAAMEAVIGDLDLQVELPQRPAASSSGVARRRPTTNMGLMFGRRAAPPAPFRPSEPCLAAEENGPSLRVA
jgi:hypothetical protein